MPSYGLLGTLIKPHTHSHRINYNVEIYLKLKVQNVRDASASSLLPDYIVGIGLTGEKGLTTFSVCLGSLNK